MKYASCLKHEVCYKQEGSYILVIRLDDATDCDDDNLIASTLKIASLYFTKNDCSSFQKLSLLHAMFKLLLVLFG